MVTVTGLVPVTMSLLSTGIRPTVKVSLDSTKRSSEIAMSLHIVIPTIEEVLKSSWILTDPKSESLSVENENFYSQYFHIIIIKLIQGSYHI